MSDVASRQIDGDTLADALLSGIHRVIGQQEFLNRINVFPVADRDTGTNLSLTLGSALSVLHNSDQRKHLGSMLAALADVLLDSARGNSGAIIAQFFQGMSDSAGEITHFSLSAYSRSVSLGADYARDALSNPCDGTILSVVAAFSESVTSQVADPARDFATVMSQARLRVDEALANTTRQLEILRKAGVVDAGAQGFAELVGGMSDFLSNGQITPLPETALLDDIQLPVETLTTENASQFRYCTECLVTAAEIDRRKLREALAGLGDSIVLAGSKRKAKIHIHVDDPNTVFDVARLYGVLSGEKADDMRRQQSLAHQRSKTFAVITDSGADICEDDMDRLDIHMVPCRIQFGDRGYLDKVSITTDEFYTELEKNPRHPTTSQPAPGDFRRQFQFLASHFSEVLSINLTSQASGTFSGAQAAAKRVDAAGRIHVLDSLNASVGQGQLTVLAAECAAAGMNVDRTLRFLKSQIPKIRTFALLNDLRFAVRGGRLPQWVKTMADLMHVTPVICIKPDGRIGLGGCLLGRRNRIAKFARFVAAQSNHGKNVEIGIGHAICPTTADSLVAELRRLFPKIDKLKICSLGTGLGVHGGPGTLIVSIRPAVSADDVARGLD